MVQINFAHREVNCKLVYYGPGLSGKTTNLEIIFKKVPEQSRGQMTSIATEQDRTLFFDFLPLDLGSVAGMKTKFFLYTVPGQVYYNSTRKLVLQGADGIVFVADSGPDRMADNQESMKNLMENLVEYSLDIRKIPLILQYNKRDLPGALSIAELNSVLNPMAVPYMEAVAVKGDGVLQTLKALMKIVLDRLNDEYKPRGSTTTSMAAAEAPAPAPAAVPVRPAPPPASPPSRPAAVAAVSRPSSPVPPAAPSRPAVPASAPRPTTPARPAPVPVSSVRPAAAPPRAPSSAPSIPAAARPVSARPPAAPSVRPAASRPPSRVAPAVKSSGGSKTWIWLLVLLVVAGVAAGLIFTGVVPKFWEQP